MRVLVTFAVEAEFASWRKRHRFAPVELGDLNLLQTRIGEGQVHVLLTGIGPKRAAASMSAASMLRAAENRWFDCCVSAGLAGSLRAQHRPAEILAGRCVQSESLRRDSGGGTLGGDSALLAIAQECGAKVVDTFLTVERIVVSAAEKSQLGRKADAVDMESFEVLKEAAAWGARGIAVRAISDSAEADLPIDFNRVLTPDGRVSVRRILRELRVDPGKILALVRFGNKSRQASRALANFLDRFLPALSASDALSRQEATEEVSAT